MGRFTLFVQVPSEGSTALLSFPVIEVSGIVFWHVLLYFLMSYSMLSVSVVLGMMLYLGKHFLIASRSCLAVVSKMFISTVMWQEKSLGRCSGIYTNKRIHLLLLKLSFISLAIKYYKSKKQLIAMFKVQILNNKTHV